MRSARLCLRAVAACWLALALWFAACKQSPADAKAGNGPSAVRQSAPAQSYLGFDRNDYPGEAALRALKQDFAFLGYWLTAPPGERSSSWLGKRESIESLGFGFLLIANGRLAKQLGDPAHASRLGAGDALRVAAIARREGFPGAAVIFVDQEQGGKMLPAQLAYLLAWFDGIAAAGFHAGVYCSAIPALEPNGSSILTAEDIRAHAGQRQIVFWVYNDFCPPAPGCVFTSQASLASSGVAFAQVWQFAESPREKDRTPRCAATYDPDDNCYPPRLKAAGVYVDLDLASSLDPSHARQ
jgi:hypothetical protein